MWRSRPQLYCSISFCEKAPSGPWPPHSRGFQITHNDAPQSVGLLWTSEYLVARDLYLPTHNRQTSMPSVGFESTISAGERPQTYALDRAATETSQLDCFVTEIKYLYYYVCLCGPVLNYAWGQFCLKSRVTYQCVLFYCVYIAVLHTVVAGLLARSQYPEGPANGHLGTGFSWFPCV